MQNFVINTIKDGNCFFIYFNDPDYLKRSLLAADPAFGPVPGISNEYRYGSDNEWEEKNIETNEDYLTDEVDYADEVDYEEEYPIKFDEPKSGITEYLNVSALRDPSFKTGVFIPPGFSQSNKVDLVIYLHGQFRCGNKKNGIKHYWTGYSNIREYFSQSQRNAILIAPTLGRDPQSPAILLKNPGGLDNFVSACFKELISKAQMPPGSEPRNIILAAHSAGGSVLSKILTNANKLLNNVIECWGFDCLYPYNWEEALKKNPGKTLFHYWAFTVGGNMSGPGTRGDKLQKSYPNLKNIAPGKVVYHRQIIEDAWINKINIRPWFDPLSSTPSNLTKEYGNLEMEQEDDEFDPNYSEVEYAEKNEETELTDELEFYKPYDFQSNSYSDEEDFESEDEADADEYQYEEETESDNPLKIDFQIPEDRLQKWRNRYIPLLDSQKSKDKNELTNLIFYDLHPELNKRKLIKSDLDLIQEWKDIYNQIVSPYLLIRNSFSSNIPLGIKKEGRGMSPGSVHYLALEGGGGRGSVYLGAILALEEQGILPISRDKSKNQIKGLVGSSAGSITSFLLSLGYTARQVQQEFFPISKPSVFSSFIDNIEPGFFRTVTEDLKGSQRNRQHNNEILDNFRDAELEPLKKYLESKIGWKKYKVIEGALEVKKWKFDNDYELPSLLISFLNDKIIDLLSKKMPMIGSKLSTLSDKLYQTAGIPSIYNLLHDGGYFTGFGVRKVLRDCLKKYFDKNGILNYDPDINFANFYNLTQIDLRVTGTNITEGFGAYFSKETTPEFPVIEAVGISGCFPFAFKPIMVYSTKFIEDKIEIYDERSRTYKKKRLYGLWADGGIANNLPLHAFDDDGILNKNILALRLTPPKKRIDILHITQVAFGQNSTIDYYSSLLSMLTSPSEESQVRSGADGKQIIDLDTGDLETTDFDPNPVKVLIYGSAAYHKVKAYFDGQI